MSSFHIAMGVRHFRPLGGAEKFTLSLARFLVARGHRVTVHAIDGEPQPGIELNLLPRPAAARAWRDYASGAAIARALAASPADVTWGEQKTWGVHIIRPNGGSEAEYWRMRAQFRGGAAAALAPFSPKRHFDLKAEARGYADPRLRRVIVNSRLVMDHLLRHYPALDGRIRVVHNGVARIGALSADAAQRSTALAEIGLDPHARTLLFAGHEFARKGLAPALAAVAACNAGSPAPVFQLIVAGRDDERPYRRQAARLGIEKGVAFVGGEKSTDHWLRVSDALIFPSYFDSFGFVIVEALAAGVPVIASRQAGGSELLTHGVDGWIVDAPDAQEQLSRGIRELTEPSSAPAYRAAALGRAGQCRMDDQLARIEEIIAETAQLA